MEPYKSTKGTENDHRKRRSSSICLRSFHGCLCVHTHICTTFCTLPMKEQPEEAPRRAVVQKGIYFIFCKNVEFFHGVLSLLVCMLKMCNVHVSKKQLIWFQNCKLPIDTWYYIYFIISLITTVLTTTTTLPLFVAVYSLSRQRH